MGNLREIRNRIESVKNTGKITRAMQMISAAKLRKAQSAMLATRPYSDELDRLITEVIPNVQKESYPLLNPREKKSVEVMVLTSDRGLCGAFNTNVLKETLKLTKELSYQQLSVSVLAMGKKARDGLRRCDIKPRLSWVDFCKKVTFDDAKAVADEIIERYLNGEIDEFVLVYNEFKSMMVQSVKCLKMLPIEAVDTASDYDNSAAQVISKYLYEPSEEEFLKNLLPKYVENLLFKAILESRVSEEASRMMAMENATKNTKELLTSLTLQYNKARQASITSELMDIVGGAEAISK
ncbi:ATP synthase F1 subunit gamma [Candidatus Magnetomonas plexicatena]|uniref:ATP synthase F1 subunit gamma n=1 Tax=Candidatus Magnetomonas plexicatena TaxID=2552947 RepID=UPI001C750027|nr:ATP synthase F1 subunit gamma [Nitrospirales bacterium LBB_01]